MKDFQQLMEKLTKAVSFKYPGPCAPSILVSSLPNKDYYVSILKYGKSHKDKIVLHKATDKDLCRALERLTDCFLSEATMPKNPIDDLRTLVSKDSLRGDLDDIFGQ